MSEGSTSWRIIEGDCRDVLASLPERSAHTCVTSPPYFGLRDYGHGGQIGLEPTPDEFVAALVDVFRGVRRVLRDDGTVWLNLGDSYNAHPGQRKTTDKAGPKQRSDAGSVGAPSRYVDGCKPKDLLGIPWLVAFALRADGWYLRSDIIWSKPNPMPESVTDRPTKAHEYVFLLSKGPRYFYYADAIREPHDGPLHAPGNTADVTVEQIRGANAGKGMSGQYAEPDRTWGNPAGRNKRSVWTVATQPYAGAHFATFPPKLIEPCILAGAPERACGECGAPWVRVVERTPLHETHRNAYPSDSRAIGMPQRSGSASGALSVRSETLGFEPSCPHDDDSATGTVLDPFAGSGTTGMVALRHGRSFVGVELSPVYAAMARWRIRDDAPLLNGVAEAA